MKIIRLYQSLLFLFLLQSIGVGFSVSLAHSETPPNILLLVADDLGYGDLGIYGGDIHTPNVDKLAGNGLLFTQFHTAPYCAPTRAMLLSGNNNHIAGMAAQHATGLMRDYVPGYERYLSNRIVPFPRLLRESGYNTFSVGKWHLGTTKKHDPKAAGFTRSFNLLHGAANHFNSIGFYGEGSIYHEDGEEVDYPKGSFSTKVYTDKLIEFIKDHKDEGKPFFGFAAYTAPHWPLQVPTDYLYKYRGAYDMGYDRLRTLRFESLKSAGIIPASSKLPPRNEAITPWTMLTSKEKQREARKMELYAAMIDNLDFHIGRLIEFMKKEGLYENTLIIFMADNGAAGEDFYHKGPFVEYIQAQYDNTYENMGKATSWVSYGPQWAEAGSAPFSRYKGYAREGGIVAPLIISGPGVAHGNSKTSCYATVMDIAPTLLGIAGARYPNDGNVKPMLGESMVELLRGKNDYVHENDYVTTLYHRGHALIRQGQWKLVTLEPPFDESKFELFNLKDDPGETVNLATKKADRYSAMIDLWRRKRMELGIILPQDL